MPSDSETENERVKSSIEAVTRYCQMEFLREHQLDPNNAPDVSQSLFTGISEQTILSKLSEAGVHIEGGLGPACVFSLPSESKNLEQVIWFDSSFPPIEQLKDYTDYNFERFLPGLTIVAEEISHFFYKDQYFKRFGKEPPEWIVELIGAMDKYNLIQKKYLEKHGRNLDWEETGIRDLILTAKHTNGAPNQHVIGHRYAEQAINILNTFYSGGQKEDAENLFADLYTSDPAQIVRIFNKLT